MTTAEITKRAIQELKLMGFECWRNNNIPVRGRTFIGKRGLADIIGFSLTNGEATMLMCEVKNIGDKLTAEQADLLSRAGKAGAFCYVAGVDNTGKFKMEKYNG